MGNQAIEKQKAADTLQLFQIYSRPSSPAPRQTWWQIVSN